MKFNLQWLSYPILGYAVLCMVAALTYVPGLWGHDITPLVSIHNIVTNSTHGVVSAAFGGLAYLAFRNTYLTLSAK